MSRKPYLVGIVGGSGAGKTSFLRDLLARLPASLCAVLSQDNYYRPIHEQELDANGKPNFDLPTSVAIDQFIDDLTKLTQGEAISRFEYTYNHRDRQGRLITIEPAEVLVLEGLFLFHFAQIRDMLDLRVFLEADLNVCKSRRLARDANERGYDLTHVDYQWEHHVLPAYEKYILPGREHAHFVVMNHEDYAEGLERVARHVVEFVARRSAS